MVRLHILCMILCNIGFHSGLLNVLDSEMNLLISVILAYILDDDYDIYFMEK